MTCTHIRIRVISMLLVITMCLCMLPVQALAATTDVSLRVQAETQSPVVVLDEDTATTAEGEKLTLRATTTQHIARDYDQTLYIQVTNNSAVMQRYYLSCDNANADLSMNFVMAGAKESPLVIEPDETQTVELSVFAQNAESTSYTVSVQSTLVTTDSEVEDASIELPFTCDPGNGQVSIEPVGEKNQNTLAQTYQIKNIGSSDIADLSLTLESDCSDYLRLDPLVENYPLAVGQSISVQLVPDLARMKTDNLSEITGTIVPTGGVAATRARSGSSFVINAELSQVKTISAVDLALYQNGNPFYNSEYAWDTVQITSKINNQETDLRELSEKYYNASDGSKDGVNTEDELNEVLEYLIADDCTYHIAMQTTLQYKDESGTQKDVGINIEASTTMLQEVPESLEPQYTYYYDVTTDTLRVVATAYNTAVDEYLAQIENGKSTAADKVGVSLSNTAPYARSARVAYAAVMESSTVELSRAGLEAFQKLAAESTKLDFSNLNPSEIPEYKEVMKQVGNLADATAPLRTMAKYLDTAANVSELVVDLGKMKKVMDDPTIPLEDKLGYSTTITLKNIFGTVLNASIIGTTAGIGSIFLDGVGWVAGAALGSVVAGYINELAEEDLELYEQLFAQMRFRTKGQQCTNRGYVESKFTMPAYTSNNSDAISACLEVPSVHVSSRIYNGKPYYEYYADDQFGGDEYAHHREVTTDYKLNNTSIGEQQENGLSEMAFADFEGEKVAAALKSGEENSLVRDYDTNAGHYLVETDTTITVDPGGNFELGYINSPDELADVRQLPDFAVYTENILPENGFILGVSSEIGVSVSNMGSAGGWVNVTAKCNDTVFGTKENIYIAPFSAQKVIFSYTPTEENNEISIELARPDAAEDGLPLDTAETDLTNNQATAILQARERMVPKISSLPELVRFEEIPRYAVKLEDALDVKSVTVRVGNREYTADLQVLNGEYDENLLQAIASLNDLGAGTYQATVTVNYYATENGQTVTRQLTESGEVILQQDVTISFYVDCPSTCIKKTALVQIDRNGAFVLMPNVEIGYAMQTNPCEFTVSYGLRTPDELDDCYFIVQYDSNLTTDQPGGIAIASLNGLAGRILPTSGDEVAGITLQTTGINSIRLYNITAINGIPFASSVSSSSLPQIARYDGKIYFSGADSIQARVSVNPLGNHWFYTQITISREKPEVTVKDFYTTFILPIDTANLNTSRFVESAQARLTDAQGVEYLSNATVKTSGPSAYIYLPVQPNSYNTARATIYYVGTRWIACFDVDLVAEEKISQDRCKKISFLLPDGTAPLDCQLTITRQGDRQSETQQVSTVYLAPGTYDVTLQYRVVSDGPLYTHQQTIVVTDTESTTITLSDSGAVVARAVTSALNTAGRIDWPMIFSSAAMYVQTDAGWSEASTVSNNGSVAWPQNATQVRLELAETDREAIVISPIPDNGILSIGDTFNGTATAKKQTYTAGEELTLRLANLMSGSAKLTDYQAQTDAAVLTGEVTLRGTGGTYALPITVSNLAEDLQVSLPETIKAGSYTCTISLVTSRTLELPDDPDDDQPGEEPSGSGGGGGGGGGGGATYVVSTSGTSNGTISISPKTAAKDEMVTITVKPDDGYALESLIVKDAEGNAVDVTKKNATEYTFKMPASKVTISATFAAETVEPTSPFTDVASSAYYYDAVLWAVVNDITNGTSATTFSPNADVSRAQMVTFLWRAAGSPKATGANPFTDVKSGDYYYDAVLWAVASGVTNGTTATTFSPEAAVSRAQAVTFQWRAAGSPSASADGFADVAVDAYYADAVAWAVANEITNGMSATSFGPDVTVIRAQAVTFLYRAAN